VVRNEIKALWDMTAYSSVNGYQSFRENFHFHFKQLRIFTFIL